MRGFNHLINLENINLGSLIRNSNELTCISPIRFTTPKRLYATETSNVTPKNLTKWAVLKTSAKIAFITGIGYGCYGTLSYVNKLILKTN